MVLHNKIQIYHFWKAKYKMLSYNTGINIRKQYDLSEVSNPDWATFRVILSMFDKMMVTKEKKRMDNKRCHVSVPPDLGAEGDKQKKSRRDAYGV